MGGGMVKVWGVDVLSAEFAEAQRAAEASQSGY